MIRKSSENLLRFYKEWLEWAESEDVDLIEHDIFRGNWGLCTSVQEWGCSANIHNCSYEMKQQFADAGLDTLYPFGARAYDIASFACAQHYDENRLNWVRARIADLENV